jgi:hypothetical protein
VLYPLTECDVSEVVARLTIVYVKSVLDLRMYQMQSSTAKGQKLVSRVYAGLHTSGTSRVRGLANQWPLVACVREQRTYVNPT